MREIKFREAIFAEPDNRFIGFHYWGWIDGEWEEPESTDPEASNQYIGLLDKNDEEIYGGDIVETAWGIGQINFEEGTFYIHAGKCRDMPDKTTRNFILFSDIQGEMTIIGNIYESPELLV